MPRHICTFISSSIEMSFEAVTRQAKHLDASHHFVWVAVESLGVLQLFQDLGHHFRKATGEQRSSIFSSKAYLWLSSGVTWQWFWGQWVGGVLTDFII